MLHTIRKDREKITAAVKAGAGSCSTKVSSGQFTVMVQMEKMLVTWTFNDTKKKAMECFNHLKQKMGLVPEFNASTGWFYKFKTRYGFHNVKRSREAKSAEEDTAASYPDRLRAIIEEGDTSPSRFLMNGPAVKENA